jgi:2-polyprenyl-3-methyl-5-hydroxy-6-metoxy-1,4-benzoquinol methylase
VPRAGLESSTPEGYYEHARSDIFRLVRKHAPTSGSRILELGCATGLLGEMLKTRGVASLVHGIEVAESPSVEARKRLDHVWVSDLSTFDWTELDGPYDIVIAADVLEHLPDPWLTLRQLSGVLATEGKVIASIPNVRYWKVMADLLFRGRFQYVDAGVLDRSHLRFFTRNSIRTLFGETGYSIEYLAPKPISRRGWRSVLMSIAGDFAHVQYHVVASPSAN